MEAVTVEVKKLPKDRLAPFQGDVAKTGVRKFYVLDRDDTLIDKDGALIHPEVMVPFVQMIEHEEGFQWAIASSGAIELQEDEGYKALSRAMGEITKTPIYVQFNRENTLLKSVVTLDNIEAVWDSAEENIDHVKKAQVLFDILLNGQFVGKKTAEEENDLFFSLTGKPIKSEHSATTVLFTEKSTVSFQFGNTIVKFKLDVLLKNIFEIAKGDYKLFFLLQALDAAQLKPMKSHLDKFGVVSIKTPDNYTKIVAENVVFLDDKESNCDVIKAAGFTAILADTVVATHRRTHEPITTDTYLAKLAETIPPDVRFRNLSAEITAANLNSLSAENIESLRNQVLTLLKDHQVLPGIKLSELAPLFDYSRFYLFKPSIKPLTSNPQILALADKYIEQKIYIKEIADFLVLRLCKDWKRAEIQEKVAAIANIKPDGQITVSPTHFRMAYVAQYQSEFFKNPRSKMLKRIEQDPVAFDNTDINAIVSEENGRSQEVLTKLGQRA